MQFGGSRRVVIARGGREGRAVMENARQVEEYMDPTATVGGGAEDAYGEDRATEEQLVTPWTFSVARSNFVAFSSLPSFPARRTTFFLVFSLKNVNFFTSFLITLCFSIRSLSRSFILHND